MFDFGIAGRSRGLGVAILREDEGEGGAPTL